MNELQTIKSLVNSINGYFDDQRNTYLDYERKQDSLYSIAPALSTLRRMLITHFEECLNKNTPKDTLLACCSVVLESLHVPNGESSFFEPMRNVVCIARQIVLHDKLSTKNEI